MRRVLPLLAVALLAPCGALAETPVAELARLRAENAKLQQSLQEAQGEAAKYKEAYVKIVDGAQATRVEHDGMKAQAETAGAALAACEDKNIRLVKLGREIIAAYSRIGFGDVLVSKEPITGLKRLELERMAQEYGDRVYEAKFDRRLVKAAPKTAAPVASTPVPAAAESPK